MTKTVEDRLEKIPVINGFVRLFKTIKLPGLEGATLYDLLERYLTGIAKGSITTRASAIAFSFFMAIFPFLLFVLIVIPYVPIDDFKIEFLRFLESFLPSSTSDFFFESIFEGIDNSQRGGLISSVFVLSIFLMANGVNAVFAGFAHSYHKNKLRSPIRQYLVAVGVALILGFLLILMIIRLLAVGKTDNKQLDVLINDYIKRLSFYVKFSLEIIPDVKNAKNLSESQQKKAEAEQILKKVNTSDVLILLDENGSQSSSVEFSEYLQKHMNSGVKQLVFVIGGPYGFSDELYAKANGKISLSKMTFSHQMIRLFFIEQLYRSFTILKNEPYHHK